jgi:hypothetical protein
VIFLLPTKHVEGQFSACFDEYITQLWPLKARVGNFEKTNISNRVGE